MSIVALLLVATSGVLTSLVVHRDRLWRAISSPILIDVVIASTPSGATTYIDGILSGKTPLKIAIQQGQHSVELKKREFQDTSKAFFAAYTVREGYGEPLREINIEMKPLGPAIISAATPITPKQPQSEPKSAFAPATVADSQIRKDIRELRAMIMANPGEAVTVKALQDRVRLQNDEVKSLRDDVREVKEQSRLFIGALVTVLLGVFAAVIAVFVAVSKKA